MVEAEIDESQDYYSMDLIDLDVDVKLELKQTLSQN